MTTAEQKPKLSFVPYDGGEPYIFISYAHKDTGRVEPYLRALQERNYRFWYDEGISPSSKSWTEVVGEHLLRAEFVLQFMSDNAAASSNVCDEIALAKEESVPMIVVYLEETSLTSELKLLLSRRQRMYSYHYTDIEVFLKKLFKDKLFEKVQEAVEKTAATSIYAGQYTGRIIDGKPEDPNGTIVYDDGAKYVGSFINGHCNGQGTYTRTDGQQYVGEFKNNKRHGYGTNSWPDGDKYEGEHKNGIRNGQGTYTFADGNQYEGEWKDDKRNGQGTFVWLGGDKWHGDKYEGEFKDNVCYGKGTYFFSNGDKYEGEFRDHERNGKGTETYYGGDKCVGEFKGGKLNGQGSYYYASGAKYVGEFRDGDYNGYGTYYNADGTIYHQGQWKDDEFIGNNEEGAP